MAKKEKFKDNTLNDLLALREAAGIVYDYYDNLAQANHGMYDDYKKTSEQEYINKRNAYHKLGEEIFTEIQKRVDSLL